MMYAWVAQVTLEVVQLDLAPEDGSAARADRASNLQVRGAWATGGLLHWHVRHSEDEASYP